MPLSEAEARSRLVNSHSRSFAFTPASKLAGDFAALRMTTRRAKTKTKAKMNTGVLRCAQDDKLKGRDKSKSKSKGKGKGKGKDNSDGQYRGPSLRSG